MGGKKIYGLAVFSLLSISSQAAATEWNQVGDANWSMHDDQIRADAGNGFLVTPTESQNFHIKVDFRPDRDSNSGIFLRCNSATEVNDKNCYEINIFDSRPDQSGRTGAIVNYQAPKVVIDTEEQWNTFEIWANGPHLTVKLNGQVTADLVDPTYAQGFIALQYASGGITFRNFTLTEVPADQAATSIDGVWELTKFELDDGKGTVTPWCEDSHGVIIYTKGYMSVAINCTSKPEKMVHYSGPFTVEDGYVFHHVQNFSAPGLHQIFKRQVVMPTADTLDLVGPFGDGGKGRRRLETSLEPT